MRTITVYSTKNTTVKRYETETTSWEEFRNMLIADGYDLHNLQATENVNRTTLLNLDAVLPNQDFVLFLRPVETKQGATMTRSEIYAKINEDPDLKQFVKDMVSTGNYTNASSDELQTLIFAYYDDNDSINDEEYDEEDDSDEDDNIDEAPVTEENAFTQISIDLENTMSTLEKAKVAIEELQECISSLHTRLNFPELEKEARELARRML